MYEKFFSKTDSMIILLTLRGRESISMRKVFLCFFSVLASILDADILLQHVHEVDFWQDSLCLIELYGAWMYQTVQIMGTLRRLQV